MLGPSDEVALVLALGWALRGSQHVHNWLEMNARKLQTRPASGNTSGLDGPRSAGRDMSPGWQRRPPGPTGSLATQKRMARILLSPYPVSKGAAVTSPFDVVTFGDRKWTRQDLDRNP
jgi:hypothetical protein